jgi:hypothetical protein
MFNFKEEESSKVFHVYQSEYARLFLEKNGVKKNLAYLSDYLNATFLNQNPADFSEEIREKLIVYNPAKGLKFTQKLIHSRPDLNWVPIQKMNPTQVQQLLRKSRVYIDFGHHPGKDRLPREAAVSGCCVITGKEGAAANPIDCAFPDTFKFDQIKTPLAEILDQIEYCLNNYTTAIQDFSDYRKQLAEDEKIFEESIKSIFIKKSHS